MATMHARYSGVLVEWVEKYGFGEIEPDPELHQARQVVSRTSLAAAGITDPASAIGTALTFEIGGNAGGRDGPSGAVNIAPAA